MKLKIIQHNRRPSLLDCILRQKFLRIANESAVPNVMAAYEAAERELAAAMAHTPCEADAPSSVKQPKVKKDDPVLKPLIPVGVDAVEDDGDEIETDRVPLDEMHVVRQHVPVAGMEAEDVETEVEDESEVESAA